MAFQEQELLAREDAKKRSADATRNGPGRPGMSLPPPSLNEPVSKRHKPDMGSIPPPPPPPPMNVTHLSAPPSGSAMPIAPEDPFAVAGSASAAPAIPIDSGADLIPEDEFVASLSKPEVELQIRIPNDRTQLAWNFYGQMIAQSADVMSTVKSVKEELSSKHLNSMPVNKIQLKNLSSGAFLKDTMTLATLNIGPTATLEMTMRQRGRRR
jgi:hypothetical protein